jgi:hypothetical protein
MSKAKKKAESIREDGTKGTLVPFPYEEVIGLIEELEDKVQALRRYNKLVKRLKELGLAWRGETRFIWGDGQKRHGNHLDTDTYCLAFKDAADEIDLLLKEFDND